MIAQAIFQILSGAAGLQALVEDRVYPVVLPQGATMPAVTFQRVTTERTYTNTGPTGEATVTVQINVWEQDPLKAAQVGAEVVKAMHGAWNGTVAGVELGAINCLNEMDAYDEEADLAGVQSEWSVKYIE